MNNHRRFASRVFASIVAILTGALAAAQDADRTATTSEELLQINAGIRAYLDSDELRAAEIFNQVLEQDENNAAALYYLGLIELQQGLNVVRTDPETARQRFMSARNYLERVTRLADPRLTSVEAGLLLGIAQLASGDTRFPEEAVELAQRARQTLEDYVTTSFGQEDRFGAFYLAVAYYRLGDYYASAGQYAEATNAFDNALTQFANAESRARVDRAGAEADPPLATAISEAKFERFSLVITYYRGLVMLQRRRNVAAREALGQVRDNDTTRLGSNARGILEQLDKVESTNPLPLSFNTPIGPLDFDARITAGAAWDSNVILLGDDTILPLNIDREDDFSFGTSLNFNISRYISKAEAPIGESLAIGVGGTTAHRWQPNIPEFDQNIYAGRAFANWQPIPDIYLGLEYEYSYTMLGHDPFIAGNRLTPVISKLWATTDDEGLRRELGRTDFWYNIEWRNYLEELSDLGFNRDGTYQAVGIRQAFNLAQADELYASYFADRPAEQTLFGRRPLSVYVGYVFREERTVGEEFDLAGHSIIAGVALPLPHRFRVTLDSIFTWENYAQPSLLDYRRSERRDFQQRYEFGVERVFVARGELASLRTLEITLRGGIDVTLQDSNIWDRLGQDFYEYSRAIYGLKLDISF